MSTNHKTLNNSDNHTSTKVTIKLFLDGFRKYCRLFNMNSKKNSLKKKRNRLDYHVIQIKKITRIYFVKLVLNTVVVCI